MGSWLRLVVVALTMIVCCRTVPAAAPADVSRTLEPGKTLDDPRLRRHTLGDQDHPWKPAKNKVGWQKQSKAIGERVRVSLGLWPMPPAQPLRPVIHGKSNRGDYTIEKVFFASLPGHYVTGNLYRPTKTSGKVPGVLCPLGHWAQGRFYDAGDKEAKKQIAQKAEITIAAARYPFQAEMAQLVRMGCVVFHYDMVGQADSGPIEHGAGFTDAEAELRLQSAMGLQTFNSIRALDFLCSLPDVDSSRIGVTGAGGGGTQTLMLCAVDPRPTVSFPAAMVSTARQGGCVCENADFLRIGINNVAIAALFAPKPLAMSGANDGTIDIETKGLPELKQVYTLYGRAANVEAKCFPQFGHNYNRIAREMMYNWFNEHLHLGRQSPIAEQEFVPIPPKDLTVFDAEHPRPTDAKSAGELRHDLTAVAEKQFAALLPNDKVGVDRYRKVVGTALRVLVDPGSLEQNPVRSTAQSREQLDPDVTMFKGIAVRKDGGDQVPYLALEPQNFNGTGVVWIDGKGKSHLFGSDGKPNPHVRKLLDAGDAVAAVDLFLTGESADPNQPANRLKVDPKDAGYTFCYNRPVLANRVRDVLTSVAVALGEENVHNLELVGTGEAGPAVLLASGFLRQYVHDIIADARGLSFNRIPSERDPNFLPGALKYGGLAGLTALAAPTNLEVFGTNGIPPAELAPLTTVFQAAGGSLKIESGPLTGEMVVRHLLKN